MTIMIKDNGKGFDPESRTAVRQRTEEYREADAAGGRPVDIIISQMVQTVFLDIPIKSNRKFDFYTIFGVTTLN